jgi:hypothetical protein
VDGISVDIDDRVMVEAIGSLAADGMKAANKRAVLKTAQLATRELKAATRGAMFNEPGGYDPFKAANYKRPRVRTRGSEVSAGAGYSQEGSFDRFRSTGTGPRYRSSGRLRYSKRSKRKLRVRDQGGAYTGIEQGFGMVQIAAAGADPLFPAICEVEMIAEVKKRGL